MVSISRDALRVGCDRARDLFMLNRLQGSSAAAETAAAVLRAHGLDEDMREELERAGGDLVPVTGFPALEQAASSAMLAGILVGLLIADGMTPSDELDLPGVRA